MFFDAYFECTEVHLPSFFTVEIPMNKIKVGAAPPPNVKDVKSKIGSLPTASSAAPKPPSSQVKIEQKKLNWNAESKIGSLSNVKYAPAASKVKVSQLACFLSKIILTICHLYYAFC